MQDSWIRHWTSWGLFLSGKPVYNPPHTHVQFNSFRGINSLLHQSSSGNGCFWFACSECQVFWQGPDTHLYCPPGELSSCTEIGFHTIWLSYHHELFIVKIKRPIIRNLYRGTFLKRTKLRHLYKSMFQLHFTKNKPKKKKTWADALSRTRAAMKRRILGDAQTGTPGLSPVVKCYGRVSSSWVQSTELLEKHKVTEVSVCSFWISCASGVEIGTRSVWTCAVAMENGNAWTSAANGNVS